MDPTTDSLPRIAVVGAGSIGCFVGGMLAEHADITLVGRDRVVSDLLAHGLTVHPLGAAPRHTRPERVAVTIDPAAVAGLLANDLQPAALSLMPALRRTLRAGQEAGALHGLVSGSGPTCLFVCSDREHAIAVAAEVSAHGVAREVRITRGPVAGAHILDSPRQTTE